MATSKLTADIPGIGEILVNGNIATEETLADLLEAIERLNNDLGVETKKLDDQLDETADELDDFSASVEQAQNSQNKLTQRITGLADRVDNTMTGLSKFSGSTESASDMVETFGEIAAKFAGGVGGLIPFIGEGTARLAEATAMAVTTLTAMAVGMVEQFRSLNRGLMDSGTLLDGGFSGLANAADTANIPITAFGEAVLANTNRLRLLEGGQPGGIARLSRGFKALSEAQENNLESLYALGFNNSEVAAGMANVSIAAQRAGKNLSSEELGAETFGYLKNLRELSRLTGISAEEAMSQVEANRANLFVQNQLMNLAPAQQAAAENFVASLEKTGLGPLADFAMTGQYLTEESAIMATRMGPLAGIMRQYFLDLQSGADPNVAMQRYRETVALNQDSIRSAMESNARTFGLTRDLASQFGYLGEAGVSITEQLNAAGLDEDPLSGAENLSITIGALQQAVQDSQSVIQSTFVDGLDKLSGDEGLMTEFARNISGAAIGAERFGEAMAALMEGDYEKLAEMFESSANSGPPGVDPAEIIGPDIQPGSMDELTRQLEFLTNSFRLDTGANRRGEKPWYMPQSTFEKRREEFYEDPDNQKFVKRIAELEALLGETVTLPGYSTGGISRNPASGALEMLHGTEAVVPLPDGRSIPVSLNLSELVDLGSLENLIKSNISGTLTSGLEKAIFPLSVSKAIPIDLNLVDDKLSNLDNNKEPIDLNPVIDKLSNLNNNKEPIDINLSNFQNLTSDDVGSILNNVLTDFRNFSQGFIPLNQLSNELSSLTDVVNNTNAPAEFDIDSLVSGLSSANAPNNTEMVNLTKNMLQQMVASTQKLDELLKSMDNSNLISRNTAYMRA